MSPRNFSEHNNPSLSACSIWDDKGNRHTMKNACFKEKQDVSMKLWYLCMSRHFYANVGSYARAWTMAQLVVILWSNLRVHVWLPPKSMLHATTTYVQFHVDSLSPLLDIQAANLPLRAHVLSRAIDQSEGNHHSTAHTNSDTPAFTPFYFKTNLQTSTVPPLRCAWMKLNSDCVAISNILRKKHMCKSIPT